MRCKELGVIILIVSFLLSCTGCAASNTSDITRHFSQDANHYIKNQPSVVAKPLQEQYAQNYLAHYFSPWTGQLTILSEAEIGQTEKAVLASTLQRPGYGENQQPLTAVWVRKLAANMDLQKFPNKKAKAITLQAVNIRLLPTNAPAFSALKPAWDNYPFDNLQVSYLPANTPILILQTTQDHGWLLIMAHNVIGWIPTNAVAYINENFVQQWRTKKMLAPLQDNIAINTQQQFRFYTRLGALHPLIAENNNNYEILVAVANADQHAIIQHAEIAKQIATIFPLPATTQNFAAIINSQISEPYGWGGLYGYRDCSSTLADIFTPFGIWLPRNSKNQAAMGNVIALRGLSDKQKQEILLKKGVSLLTFIRLPGHIMLYLGQQNGHAFVFQNVWGLHTKNWLTGKEGRKVIGRALIMPLDDDQSRFNRGSLLARTQSITILTTATLD